MELERYEFEELVAEARWTSEFYSGATLQDVWIHIRTTPQRLNGPFDYHAYLELNQEEPRVFETLDDAEFFLRARFEVEY